MYEIAQDRYVGHEPCPKCGSKDNLARYESGSGYCFGCGEYFHRLGGHRMVVQPGNGAKSKDVHQTGLRPPPDDCNTEFPSKVVEWISKYDLTPADLIKHNVVWSKSREQLIYRFFGEGKDLVLWQARNFREGVTHKDRFFTGGTPNEVVAAYHSSQSRSTGVIVEDCISAIKVCQAGGDGIPCFGSTLSDKKLTRLAGLYDRLYIWLDFDKFKESTKMARKAGLLGCSTRTVCTEDDPKIYSLDFIGGMIV